MTARDQPAFVLFGGTFNPVHLGHLGLIRGLLQREDVQRVFVVPAARNPFKAVDEPLPATLRLDMLQRALRGISGVSVLDLELRRGQPSYSVETVAALASKYPGVRLMLAMGWDVYETFGEWHNAGGILERAGLMVVTRNGAPLPAHGDRAAWLCGLPPGWRKRVRMGRDGTGRSDEGRELLKFINLRLPNISSTQIRNKHNSRQVPEAARDLLDAYWAAGG